jgi:hypothetical protein
LAGASAESGPASNKKGAVMARRFVYSCAALAAVASFAAAASDPPDVRGRRSVASAAGEREPGAPLAITLDDVRLEEALAYWSTLAGVRVEPMWTDARHFEGLDRDRRVSVTLEGTPIEILEAIVGVAHDDEGAVTWQATRRKSIQVGPRARLNAFRRVEVYDVADLLSDAPHFAESPAIGLDSTLRLDRGSPFSGDEPPEAKVEEKSERERIDDLIALIVDSIEPEQWEQHGGAAASIRTHGSVLVVHAPEYVHRALAKGLR